MPHRHLVSFGMSELYYDPQSAHGEFSGWGFEFSMRIAPFADNPDTESFGRETVPNEPFWAISLMQNLAKYVYKSKKWFEAYHFIPTNSPLHLNTDTKLVGVAFAPYPLLGSIDTPNGKVEFLQMVGPHAARGRLAARRSDYAARRAAHRYDARGQSFTNHRFKSYERIRLI